MGYGYQEPCFFAVLPRSLLPTLVTRLAMPFDLSTSSSCMSDYCLIRNLIAPRSYWRAALLPTVDTQKPTTGGWKSPDRDLVVASVPLILGKLRRRCVYSPGGDAMPT